jgi:hypothetical protein
MEGEAALSQFPREKSKGRVRWHWERHVRVTSLSRRGDGFGIIIAKTRGASVITII